MDGINLKDFDTQIQSSSHIPFPCKLQDNRCTAPVQYVRSAYSMVHVTSLVPYQQHHFVASF